MPELRGLPRDAEIGGFRVEAFLGEGAMAQVYAALDLTLGRRVALKVFKPAAVEGHAETFLQEARATAAIDHPNIVRIYQTGVHNGMHFLALELVEGETLRQRIRSGPLATHEALRIGHAIAEGLAAAHAGGYVHGDLKPENVLIAPSGRIRVVDFGLARSGGSDAIGAGTAQYMAPERWRSLPLGPAADTWALGILLCELLQGRAPFEIDEIVKAVYSRVRLTAPPVLAALHEQLANCLAWEPAERPSAASVAHTLTDLLLGEISAKHPPFRGLSAFSEADAADFWGRDDETDLCIERLRRTTLLTIVGPSGVGKSSFVRARLVPRLRERGPHVVFDLRPGSRPLHQLVRTLGATLDEEDAERQIEALTHAPERFRLMLADCARAHGHSRIVLFVDQLEEAITLAPTVESHAFFAALLGAAEPSASWRVVAAVRDDFLGRIYQTALGDRLDVVVPLRPLGITELEAAIRGPVRRQGFEFEPTDLPARIARDVADRPAPLPLLQFACHALWEHRDVSKALVLGREYERLGGAAGILAREAEHLVSSLPPAERDMTRALMLSLVRPDGTRVPVRLSDIARRFGAGRIPLIERFVASRLLAIRRDGDDASVELAHESLTSLWPDLRRWLDDSSELRRLIRDLETAAELWDGRRRPVSETWRGDAVRSAMAKLQEGVLTLSTRAEQFLRESEREDRRVGVRRRRLWIGFLALLAAFAATASVFAARFRAKEQLALEEEAQVRMAADNHGRVELTLAPFAWDAAREHRIPVPQPAAANLRVRLWRADPAAAETPILDAPLELTDEHRTLQGDEVVDSFEARGGLAFLEITGRGSGCAASWVRLRAVPGYAERRRGEVLRVHLPVPTCAASSADLVPVPAGAFLLPSDKGDQPSTLPAFSIDRYEATNADLEPLATLLPVMGYERLWPPDEGLRRGASGNRYPATGVDVWTAQAVCRFYGKRLPTSEEWAKAYRGPVGPDGTDGLDVPARALAANLFGDSDGSGGPAPVDRFTGDRSPYGVMDMTGNVREWTGTRDDSDKRQSMYRVMGGDYYMPRDRLPEYLFENENHPRLLDFGLGFRCASDGVGLRP